MKVALRSVIAWLLPLTSLIVLFSAIPPIPLTPIALLREGDAYYQRQQYTRSLERYTAAGRTGVLGAVPGSRAERARLTLGKRSAVTKAADDLDGAGIDQGNRMVARGILAFQWRDYAGAVSQLNEALAFRPLDEEARYFLGRSYLLLGEYDAASEEFGKLLAGPDLGPSRWREASHYNLGLIDLVRHEPSAAEHFRKAESSKLDASMTEKARTLTAVVRTLGDLPAWEVEARVAIGSALLSVGEERLARVQLEEAIALRPASSEAMAYLGYLSWLEVDYDRADSLLQQSISLRPYAPLAHYFLGVLRRSQGRPGEAFTQFELVIDIDPESAPAYVELARTLVMERNYGGAAAAFERAIEIDPDNVGYLVQLARFYQNHALRLERALSIALRAAQLAPGHAEALDVLGWAYWTNGQTYDARRTLEMAIAANPDLASARYHLATLLERVGETRAAAQELRHALDLEPEGEYAARAETLLSSLDLR